MFMTRRRPTRGLCAAVSMSLLAACGSALTDEEIVARAGEQVTTEATTGVGAAATPSGATATSLAAGAAPEATETAPGADAEPEASAGGPAARPTGAGSPGPAGGAAACTDTATGPVIVGNVGDYTGPTGASVADQPNGVRIWAADINSRGGLCGRQVQILSGNAGGDPARNASLVREQVERQGAVGFVSNSVLTSGSGGYPYIIQNGIPSIGDSISHESARSAPTIMANAGYFADTGLAFLRAASRIGQTNVFGLLYCVENKYCSDIRDGYSSNAAAAGADWRWEASASLLQVDYTAECQGAQRAGVELLIIMMDAASVSRIARSCNRQGFNPVYVLIGNAIRATTTQEPGLENAIVLGTTFPFAGASTPAIDAYQQARRTYFDDRPSNGALATGWASAKLFELIATRAVQASGTITTETLAAAMQTIQNETVGGLTVPLTWSAQGSTGLPCVFAVRADGNGGYTAPLGADPVC